jgi:hypothetical protein
MKFLPAYWSNKNLSRWNLVLIALILLLATLFYQLFIMIKFITIIEKSPPWATDHIFTPPEDYPLDQTKNAACFLKDRSNLTQRSIIVTYHAYGELVHSGTSRNRLFLLLRVLFDLPEDHPASETPIFAAYVGPGSPYPYDYSQETINLLWPLGYKDGELVLTTKYAVGYMGGPYQALAEYDYFMANFPLRRNKELNCR